MLGAIANRYLGISCVNEGPFELLLCGAGRPADRALPAEIFSSLVDRLSQHQYFALLLGKDYSPTEIRDHLQSYCKDNTPRGLAIATLQYTRSVLELPLLGHEDPLLIDELSDVVDLYGECRVIHIIRDPRDAASSILRFPWGANNVCVYALAWKERITQTLALGKQLGPKRYLEVRYEDLLAHPAREMTRMLEFCGQSPVEERVEKFREEMESNPLRSNTMKWKTRLTEKQVALVESAARDQMGQFGYDTTTSGQSLSPLTALRWKIHHRYCQIRAIVAGKIAKDGAAIPPFKPESEAYPMPTKSSQS